MKYTVRIQVTIGQSMITTMDLAITLKSTENVPHQKYGDMMVVTPTISYQVIARTMILIMMMKMVMVIMMMRAIIIMIMFTCMTNPLMRNGTMLMGLALYQILMGLRLRGIRTTMETISIVNHKQLYVIITITTTITTKTTITITIAIKISITLPIHKHIKVVSMDLTWTLMETMKIGSLKMASTTT
jgi:hypothetical protein